jgi:hypothetical protein
MMHKLKETGRDGNAQIDSPVDISILIMYIPLFNEV